MSGEYITINAKDGGSFRAYLALPPRGKGPGIVLCHEIFGCNATMRELADTYADEGYVVAVPDLYWREEAGIELEYTSGDWQRAFALSQSYDFDMGVEDIDATMNALRERPEQRGESTASAVQQQAAAMAPAPDGDEGPIGPTRKNPPGGIAVIGFSLGGKLAYLAACRLDGVSCAVSYYGVGIEDDLDAAANLKGRLVVHLPENDRFVPAAAQQAIAQHFERSRNVEVYLYPRADRGFSRRATETYDRAASGIAHQRTMAALKREMGPYFNLSRLWDKHCRLCFTANDPEQLLEGMVAEPCVNHVPTRTGGTGGDKVRAFYAKHFLGQMPADTRLVPISRTVGASQLVDEHLLCFTHSIEMDWLLPGLTATKRYVELPVVAIVNFRGEKINRLQLYWDQAGLLVQIGKMAPDGLPIAGIENARKLINDDLPSNEMIAKSA